MTAAQPLKAGLIFETIQQVHPHSDHDQRQSRDTRTNLSPSRSKRPESTRGREQLHRGAQIQNQVLRSADLNTTYSAFGS